VLHIEFLISLGELGHLTIGLNRPLFAHQILRQVILDLDKEGLNGLNEEEQTSDSCLATIPINSISGIDVNVGHGFDAVEKLHRGHGHEAGKCLFDGGAWLGSAEGLELGRLNDKVEAGELSEETL